MPPTGTDTGVPELSICPTDKVVDVPQQSVDPVFDDVPEVGIPYSSVVYVEPLPDNAIVCVVEEPLFPVPSFDELAEMEAVEVGLSVDCEVSGLELMPYPGGTFVAMAVGFEVNVIYMEGVFMNPPP